MTRRSNSTNAFFTPAGRQSPAQAWMHAGVPGLVSRARDRAANGFGTVRSGVAGTPLDAENVLGPAGLSGLPAAAAR
ncbi:MAG: hypothetical protein AB7G51_11205 [Steroidobacteraceae bacterium]